MVELKMVLKKYYTHEYAFTELFDYAVFKIIEKCGGTVPKVKIKVLPEKSNNRLAKYVYFFSTNISQKRNKYPNNEYRYYDIAEISYSMMNTDKFPIDKINIAKMIHSLQHY